MADIFSDTQTAIFDLLNADGTFNALVGGRIYDKIIENPTMPYITIGDIGSTSFAAHGNNGRDFDWAFHVWSEYEGNKEIQNIFDRLDVLLNRNTTLVIANHKLVQARRAITNIFMEDGKVRHGVDRYQIIVMKA